MSELSRRVATAAIALPVVVGAILWLPSPAFAAVFGVLAAVGAWEWAGLYPAAGRAWRVACTAFTLAVLLFLHALITVPAVTWGVLLGAVVWWSVALTLVVGAQQGQPLPALDDRRVHAACGVLVIVPAWLALVLAHRAGESGPALVLGLFAIIWTADCGAYFAGRRFGRRKLASLVSPGKSWEGLAGAVAAVAPAGVAFALVAGIVRGGITTFVALCIVTALVSVIGDLIESVFKRRAGVKDSGTLFPGHGGVLDRIDSITAAAPVFVIGLALHGGAQ